MIRDYFRELYTATHTGWDRFWFTPSDPATLGLIRLLAGLMVCYTHLVWTLDLEAFFGSQSWLNEAAVATLPGDDYHWSHWWLIQSPTLMWGSHIVAVAICACFALGLWTRVTGVLTWLITISYAQRVPEAMYGLDQINSWLMFYLMLGPSGAAFSLDRVFSKERQIPPPSSGANIVLRLMQLHLCLVYLSAGLAKLQGPAWWDGTALWGALANREYQTFDLTWLVHYPVLVNLLTHATVAWEISYVALVWHRITRPIVLLLAVGMHGGICVALGMPTFGLIMLIANVAFVSPALIRRMTAKRTPQVTTGGHPLAAPNYHARAAVTGPSQRSGR